LTVIAAVNRCDNQEQGQEQMQNQMQMQDEMQMQEQMQMQEPWRTLPWNPTLAQQTRKDGAPIGQKAGPDHHGRQ